MSASPGHFQILLVEDAEEDARLFEHAMHESGARAKLYWVATCDEALEFMRNEGRYEGFGPADLVVTDLNMPKLDGFGLIAELRKTTKFSCVPIVVFSGSKNPSDIQRAYGLGANSYIVKPMSLDTIVDRVELIVRYWLDTVETSHAFPD